MTLRYPLPSPFAFSGLLVALLLGCWSLLSGQTAPPTSRLAPAGTAHPAGPECPADELLSKRLEAPAGRRDFARFQEAVKAQEMRNRFRPAVHGADRTVGEVYRIPVVVHVMHIGEPVGDGSNISNAQIESAIEALNADFRRLEGTPGAGSGVDTEIEFVLASRSPEGAPTTGVVRVDAGDLAGYATGGVRILGNQGASEAVVKGLSVWPTDDYLNIWVVNEIDNNDGGAGIQGYAYLPPIENDLDGIVVLYNAFGTTGNLKPWTQMNRTLTHEAGHYLGLLHTFYGTNSCPATENNCALQGDCICDTPPTVANANCASAPVCSDAHVENYLDYTAEGCKNAFTAGQRDRMRAVVETYRPELLNSLGDVPVSQLDGALTGIHLPHAACSPMVTPVIELSNTGMTPIDSCVVWVKLNDYPEVPFFWTGLLAPGSTQLWELPELLVGYGEFLLEATLEVPVSAEHNNPDPDNPLMVADGWDGNNGLIFAGSNELGSPLVMTLAPDGFGSETAWQLVHENGAIVYTASGYPNGAAGIPITHSFCVPAGCYELVVTDAFGDGMSVGNGWFELTGTDGLLAGGGGNFGSSWSQSFCVAPVEGAVCQDANENGVCDVQEVTGCTDTSACNYAPMATLMTDCTLPDFGYDCSGNCFSDLDGDGICDDLEWPGCVDPEACNFDEMATDEGPCNYPVPGFDCEGEMVVGTQDLSENTPQTVKVYPNPTTEQPPVWTVEGMNEERLVARLYHPRGGLVWESNVTRDADGKFRLRCDRWMAAGSYILELRPAGTGTDAKPAVLHVRIS